MKIGTVPVKLEPWKDWERDLSTNLDRDENEDARPTECSTVLTLPAVLILDYDQVARQNRWTMGQFLSWLVVQGALRVVEKKGKV